jgi:hypothetical protein
MHQVLLCRARERLNRGDASITNFTARALATDCDLLPLTRWCHIAMRPVGRRGGGPGGVCTGDRRGRVAAVATGRRRGWGAHRYRSLESPACIAQLRGGVGPSSILRRRCNRRWRPSDRLHRRDLIPRCGPSSLLRRSIPRWRPAFCLRRSPARPRCGHSGRSPWRRWTIRATKGRWGTEGGRDLKGGRGSARECRW